MEVAVAAGTGRKWVGPGVPACLGEIRVRRAHISSVAGDTAPPLFFCPASSLSVTGGNFPGVTGLGLRGLVTTMEVVMVLIVRDDGRKSSSEHERAGLLLRERAGYD